MFISEKVMAYGELFYFGVEDYVYTGRFCKMFLSRSSGLAQTLCGFQFSATSITCLKCILF